MSGRGNYRKQEVKKPKAGQQLHSNTKAPPPPAPVRVIKSKGRLAEPGG